MKQKNNLKIFYYIWAVLLVVLIILTLFVDAASSLLPITGIVLFGGAALFRSWKNSVVEIEIRDGVAHMTMMDGKVNDIYIDAIVQIRETANGTHLRFADGEEVRTRKGENKVTIKVGDTVTSEFRQEDFPQAEFVKAK